MKLKQKAANIIKACLLTATFCGCSDFLSEYSQDMVIPKNVQQLDELLIGDVYMQSNKMEYGMNNQSCQFFNLLDDDINTVGTSLTGRIGHPYYNYAVNSMYGYYAWQQDVRYNYQAKNYSNDNATWNDMYRRISIVNIILDEIESLPHKTDQDYADYLRVKGEAFFLRGQFYFVLANLYGDAYSPSTCASKLCVPLKLSAHVEYDKDADRQFERESVKRIYEQIVSDLKESTRLLTESPQKNHHLLHRASWEAASLLLSRVYLFMQDWPNAEIEAEKVMNSRLFSLAPTSNFSNETPFLTTTNPEIIFSQGSNPICCRSDWSVTGQYGDYCVTNELYSMFDDNDVRKTTFFAKRRNTVEPQNDSIGLYKKYERGIEYSHISDALMLRMAEAYLNYAEACAMQPTKADKANSTLNTLRSQRITSYAPQTYSGEQLVQEIRNERRKELCFEGKRWFDLRRYAVCEQYPYSRNIIHAYAVYNDNFSFATTEYYLLPAGDPAYTFSLPRKVIEFDKVPMPDNPRNKREPLENEDEDKKTE
ncbi:RagB/SusD family nutrient uptake outer membrane protein [Bacteroides congonensis]|jgi:hypothetical protein|uniref:RagB/SusD family nutrient uptake outer membrane protein n=1 Tax=Bacteroides congonensis TaxID=1871006 RepID=UPI000933322C|nr:RagB/SusD family nutrient uptake outer membrane protein [Bacteroides congonensis]